jgi:hypothetical protein
VNGRADRSWHSTNQKSGGSSINTVNSNRARGRGYRKEVEMSCDTIVYAGIFDHMHKAISEAKNRSLSKARDLSDGACVEWCVLCDHGDVMIADRIEWHETGVSDI